jgi:dihydroneopterin triphosphate diphosphatase
MTRAPFQVLVIPFQRGSGSEHLFAVFRRADDQNWQFIAGGGEDHESTMEAAAREASEEAGIPPGCRWLELDSIAYIPRSAFPTATHWPSDVHVIPEHSFAVDTAGAGLRLSAEHSEVRWLRYADAHGLLKWESNRAALSELVVRLGLDGGQCREARHSK